MRDVEAATPKRAWWRVTGALVLLLGLGGCGGGGGGGDGGEAPVGGGQVPQAGADYFPLAAGHRWYYDDTDTGAVSVTVTGKRQVDGAEAFVVRTEDSTGIDEELYRRDAEGVVLLPGPDADPLATAIGPLRLLRLPVVVGDRWTLVERVETQLPDLDDDLLPERAVLRADARVVGVESVTTPAATTAQAVHVRTTFVTTATLSTSGASVDITFTSDDWYAPGVGLVRNVSTVAGAGAEERSERLASAWVIGTQRNETVAPTVVSREPAPSTSANGPTSIITVVFSERMDTSGNPDQVLVVRDAGGRPVAGETRWHHDERTFHFQVLRGLPSGSYVIDLGPAARDLVGNPAAPSGPWTIEVDATGPEVRPVQPLPDAVEVPLDTTIVFEVGDDADLDSIKASSVFLGTASDGRSVPFTLQREGRTVTLVPQEPLETGVRYRVGVAGVTDALGNATSMSWEFRADPGRFAAARHFLPGLNVTATAIGDVNGDGIADLLMATGYTNRGDDDFRLFVHPGDGAGGFGAPTRVATVAAYGNEAGTLAVVDLDGAGPGQERAIVLAAKDQGIQILRRRHDGSLGTGQALTTSAAYVVRVADMNGDGRPDLVGRPFQGTAVKVWLQAADGLFGDPFDVPVTVGTFGDLALGDLDGDGQVDLVVAGMDDPARPIAVVRRLPGGGYAPVAYPELPSWGAISGAAIGDVTGDGRADLVLTSRFQHLVYVLPQRPDGSLDAAVNIDPASNAEYAAIADMDGDGRDDVVAWGVGGFPVTLYRQQMTGELGPVETWPVDAYGNSSPGLVTLGDADGDGRIDIVFGDGWLRQRDVTGTPPAQAHGTSRRPLRIGPGGRWRLGV